MIGNCDACDRQNVPVSNRQSPSGETIQCYLCQGDDNPDPYCEASDMKLNLTEEWCMAAADREGNSEVGAGGMTSDFDLLVAGLLHWRNEDHADSITLNRHQVIVLLEGFSRYHLSHPRTPCPGCDGHECDDGCNYPGAYHDRLCLSCFENTVQDGRYGGYFCSDACYERISNEETREPTPQQERWPSA